MQMIAKKMRLQTQAAEHPKAAPRSFPAKLAGPSGDPIRVPKRVRKRYQTVFSVLLPQHTADVE